MDKIQIFGCGLLGCLLFLFFLLAIPFRYRISVTPQKAVLRLSWLFGFLSKEIKPDEASKSVKKPEKIRETETDISGDSEEIKEKKKKPSVRQIFFYALDNGTLALVFDVMKKIFRHGRFSQYSLCGRVGFSDPMKTGLLAGLVLCYFPSCRIEWDYVRPCNDFVFMVQGRIVPLYILCLLVSLAGEKPVRQTISYGRGASWTTPQENNFSKNSNK